MNYDSWGVVSEYLHYNEIKCLDKAINTDFYKRYRLVMNKALSSITGTIGVNTRVVKLKHFYDHYLLYVILRGYANAEKVIIKCGTIIDIPELSKLITMRFSHCNFLKRVSFPNSVKKIKFIRCQLSDDQFNGLHIDTLCIEDINIVHITDFGDIINFQYIVNDNYYRKCNLESLNCSGVCNIVLAGTNNTVIMPDNCDGSLIVTISGRNDAIIHSENPKYNILEYNVIHDKFLPPLYVINAAAVILVRIFNTQDDIIEIKSHEEFIEYSTKK